MDKIIYLEKNKTDKFYKQILWIKFLRLFKTKIYISYCGKQYFNSEKKHDSEIDIILKILDILNSKTKKEKYEFIYDYSCDYLDNEFQSKNLCGFKNNICECNRNKANDKQVSSCCESLKIRKICDNFDSKNKCCKIKSLGCKLFVCPYLRKKGIKYPIRTIPYLKYFLSIRQKLIVKSSFFQDKDYVIGKLLKFYKMP